MRSPRSCLDLHAKHGDLTLADSSVIVAYLEKRFPEHSLTPSEPVQYARMLWFEEGEPQAEVRLGSGEALSVRELPAIERMATCVRIGLPERAHLITGKIGAFLEANGYSLDGPNREVFLQPPRPDRMEESVVEMQFPVAKIAHAQL